MINICILVCFCFCFDKNEYNQQQYLKIEIYFDVLFNKIFEFLLFGLIIKVYINII
jgi:hypothetical protein